MILDFTIKNFQSYLNENTISFCEKESKPHNFIAVYGPNSSGKSNLIKALDFASYAMLNSDAVKSPTVKHTYLQPFKLNSKSSTEPSFFEIEFRHAESHRDFRYGFEMNKEEVRGEWFFEKAKRGTRTTERLLFSRVYGENIKFGVDIPKQIKSFKSTVPGTILALPYLANNSYEEAVILTTFMRDNLLVLSGDDLEDIQDRALRRLKSDSTLLKKVLKSMNALNVSIKNLELEEIKFSRKQLEEAGLPDSAIEEFLNEPRISARSIHDVYNNEGKVVDQVMFNLKRDESLGTQKLLPLVTLFLDAESAGLTVVIDEFGSSLHPFITKALVELFSKNAKKSQLLAITHETFLLNQETGLDASQLWVVEKDDLQRSTLSCLSDFSPRADARLDKQYLEGRYGAVPMIYKHLGE